MLYCFLYLGTRPIVLLGSVACGVWDEISKFTGLHDVPTVPEASTWDNHISHAKAMRQFLDRECQKTVCGVCSMMQRDQDVELHDIFSIPNLVLLDSTGPKSASQPRDALTTFKYTDPASFEDITYCLQPHACS